MSVADLAVAVVNAAVILVMIVVAEEQDAIRQDAFAYVLGVLMAAPLVVRRRWPLTVLLVVAGFLFWYFAAGYPAITPAGPLAVPLYSAVLARRTAWAIGVPALFFGIGFVMVAVIERFPALEAFAEFLPQVALLAVVILLGEVVVSRRELAAETRERLRHAEQEREREAARRVAEERVRIARELHDTVAHSMATITVQAGSALHLLKGPRAAEGGDQVLASLTAIRGAGKQALRDMRATLGILRADEREGPPEPPGLERLPALIDAVRAAGLTVTLDVAGTARPVAERVDHAAYRIVQESLTNVLRHAGPGVRAEVRVAYRPDGVELRIADDGPGPTSPNGGTDGGGHGLSGMRERAEAVGGAFSAEPGAGGGFVVDARLPDPV
ncbi:signal transduction histidine kinase [Thermomonospora umbrina]|uniref:histidine kinase n=1 Tax=Thermomonospora umbrina TaxID=111806 RepID=A0A3D9STB5_9ACTN|nr:signal transduction histidine kinase [Thermomonospora umbrina]